MKHPLTPEQEAAVEAYALLGDDLRMVAYAGAGKTSTLTAMARRLPHRRGLYVAFNKSIATEAGTKFPSNVTCRTAHSLAYRAVKQMGFSDEKMTTAVKTRDIGDARIRVDRFPEISSAAVQNLVIGTIRKFCQSGDFGFDNGHVPKLRKPMEAGRWEEQAGAIVCAAEKLWYSMVDVNGAAPLGHDGYVKLWQLNNPQLQTDVLYVDEAQDLNGVLLSVVERNLRDNLQCVTTGDSHQQIYHWRGAIDALKRLPGDEYRLTQSFRFGENIAHFANRLLRAMGERVPLRGNGRNDDQVVHRGSPRVDAVLCRSNSGVIANATRLVEQGEPVYIPGGADELLSLVQDAERLQGGYEARTAELSGFLEWHEVVDYAETEDGADLKVFVGLVEKYTCARLRLLLGQLEVRPAPGVVSVSTAHKAKGLEWDSVQLDSDFQIHEPKKEEDDDAWNLARRMSLGERRLFYVAATRAKHCLVVGDDLAATYTR